MVKTTTIRLSYFLTVFSVSLFLPGCGAFSPTSKPLSEPDFEKTELLSTGAAQANGSEHILITVHLKNSDLSPVRDYVPKYKISESFGVQATACSSSDLNGVAVCILKSTVAGEKQFILTNAKVGLAKDIQFTAPLGIQRLAAVGASGTHIETSTGSTVQLSLQPVAGVKRKTADGYTMTLSIQGIHQ